MGAKNFHRPRSGVWPSNIMIQTSVNAAKRKGCGAHHEKRPGLASRRAPFCAGSLKGRGYFAAAAFPARAPFGRWPWPLCSGLGGACFVIAILEDEHLYPLAAELLSGRRSCRHRCDGRPPSARVFNRIVAEEAAGAINSNAGVQRQYSSIGGDGPWLRPFAGSSEAFHPRKR